LVELKELLMKLMTVGSDPEFFLQDKSGRVVVSQGIVPGTKDRVQLLRNGAVHRDNVLCELNPKPAATEEEFSSNVLALMDEVTRKILKPKGVSLLVKSSHIFSMSELMSAEARTFGCSGDAGIWDRIHPPTPPQLSGRVRGAGGHIHIGLTGLKPKQIRPLVKTLDLLVSVPLVLIDPDKNRRKFYGQAGRYREKPYGIEYRTPSNAWCSSDKLRRWVFAQVRKSVESVDVAERVPDETLVSVINNSDQDGAKELVAAFDLEEPVP
jgi:hypothetical protein